MTLPDMNQFGYDEGEEWLVAYLLQNSCIDDIVHRAEASLFKNQFLNGIYTVCHDYINTTGQGQSHFQSILEVLNTMGKASTEAVQYLTYLHTKDLTQSPSIDYIIETLTECSNRRKIIFSLQTKLNMAVDNTVPVQSIITEMEEDLVNIQQSHQGKIEVLFAKDVPQRRKEGLIRRRDSVPVYTFWPGFDKMLSVGFGPGKVSVIAGRTSMGKSFFKTNLIINQAKHKVGIVNICPEQGFDSEHDRIDAIMTNIHLEVFSKIRDLPPGDAKFQMIKLQQETIATEWNYACVPTRGITVAGVHAAIRRARRGGVDPKVVFIDLFDRLDDVNAVRDRTATISRKLGEIEKIADNEGVHMVLLVQVNRGPENRKDHRPTMADLRDCGNFEQDADNIFLLFREGYYSKDLEDNMLDVEIAKQRDGGAGIVYQFMITDKKTLSIAPIGEKKFDKPQTGA